MKMLQTGDTCPLCGRPIQTTDPNKLIFLSAMAWWDEQDTAGDADLCGPSAEKSTNADKLRSLPDEELASCLMCPGEFCGGTDCKIRTGDGNDEEPKNCNICVENWLAARYDRWEDEL